MVLVGGNAWADVETVTVLSEDYESYNVGDITATMTGKGWKFQSRNGQNKITIVQGAEDAVNKTKYFDFYYPDGGASRNQSWDFGASSSLNADNWKLTFSAALNPGENNSANKFWITGTNTGKITDPNTDVTNPIFGLIGTAQAAVTYKPSIGTTAYDEEITLASGTWYKFTIEATSIDANNTKANLTVKITSFDGTTTVWEKTVSDYNMSTSGTLKGLCWNSPRGNSRLSLDDVLVTKEVSADICAEPTFSVTGPNGTSRIIKIACETSGATIYYASSELEKGAAGWSTYSEEISTDAATIYAYAAKGSITSEIVSFATGAGEAISLNAPVISATGLVANGDIFNPILTATNDQTSVQFTPTATITATFNGTPVELPYTVTEDGTLVVTVAAEGYNSASTEMSLKAKYTKSWSSSNFSALTEEDIPTVMGESWQKQEATGRWASWTTAKEPYTYYAAVGESGVFNVTVEDNLRMRNVILLNLGYGIARNVTGGEAINFLNSKVGTIAEVTYYNGYGADVSEANTHNTYLFNAGEGIPSFSTTNSNVFVQATYYAPVVENKAIFLKPGVWDKDGARYAAYAYGDGEAWFDFAAAEESGVFTANVPDNYTGLILARMNGETTENNWDNRWNQTDDIDFTKIVDNTLFTITGWGEGEGAKSTYETSEYKKDEPTLIDVTGLFLVNPSFETGDMTGWTNGGNSSDTGVKENSGNYATTNCDGKYVYNTWWQGTPLNQTIENLPAGNYTLSAVLASSDNNNDGKIFMQVGETRQLYTFPVKTGGIGVKCELPFVMTEAGNATITVVGANDAGEYVENGHWWYKADDFHLIYTVNGEIPQAILDYINVAYNAAKTAAQEALASDDYVIVTGDERTALTEVLNAEVEQTVDGLNNAATALTNATKTFTEAKEAYQNLADTKVMANVEAYSYATLEKKTAVETAKNANPTSAADATEKATVLLKAYRQYAESSAMLEGVETSYDFTSYIVNPKAEENIAEPWVIVKGEGSGGSLGILNGEPWTDGNDNATHKYFDGGDWGAQAWDVALQQEINLPKGKYQLTAKMRASGDVEQTVFAGDKSTKGNSIFATGGLFNRGWSNVSVEFELTEAGTVTIGVRGVTTKQHNWMSFSDFRLVAFDYQAPEPVYTLVGAYEDATGEQALFFGETWNPELTANDMVKQANGTYTKTFETIEFPTPYNGTIWYKVVKNHSWDENYGFAESKKDGNADYVVTDIKKADSITFVFNPQADGDKVSCQITGITTGINELNTTAKNEQKSIYTLSGQKVEKAVKGLYIINGKKVVIK